MTKKQMNKISGQHIRRRKNGSKYCYPKNYVWHIPHDLRGEIEIGDTVEVIGSNDWVRVVEIFHAEEPKNHHSIYRLVRKADPQVDFIYQLKKLRREKKLSQQVVAQSLGISPGTVSAWEQGKSKPRKSLYPKIEEVLGLKVRF